MSPNPQLEDATQSPGYFNLQREPSLGDLNLGRNNSIPQFFEPSIKIEI